MDEKLQGVVMEYQDPEKKRKILIIGGSVAAAIVILIIGVWAVTAAINSVKGEQEVANTETIAPTETTQPETVADYTTPDSPDDEKITEQVKPVEENTVETPTQTQPAPAPAQNNNLPETGPEDLSLTTLLLTPLLVTIAVALLQQNLAYAEALARK